MAAAPMNAEAEPNNRRARTNTRPMLARDAAKLTIRGASDILLQTIKTIPLRTKGNGSQTEVIGFGCHIKNGSRDQSYAIKLRVIESDLKLVDAAKVPALIRSITAKNTTVNRFEVTVI